MRTRRSSAYVSDHPLWELLAPKYQALLTTPQTLKAFSSTSPNAGFDDGAVSIPYLNPTQIVVATSTHQHCFALDQVSVAAGYAALHQLTEEMPALASPRQYISIQNSDDLALLRFDCEAAAEDWSGALKKLLTAVHQYANQECLGCLFDITLQPGPSKNWCEMRVCLVKEDESVEEFVFCDFSEPSTENRLQRIESQLHGTFDFMNAEVLRSCLEDLAIHQQLRVNRDLYLSVQLPSVPSFDELSPIDVAKIAKRTVTNFDSTKGQLALRIALSKLSFVPDDPLSRAFHLLHIQKLHSTSALSRGELEGRLSMQMTRAQALERASCCFKNLLDSDNDGTKVLENPILTPLGKEGHQTPLKYLY